MGVVYHYETEDMIAQTPWISYYNMSCVGAKIAGAHSIGEVERE